LAIGRFSPAFYQWLRERSPSEAAGIAAALMAIATEGFYGSGCGDLGDGLRMYTDKIEQGVYFRLYLCSSPEGFCVPLVGRMSNSGFHWANDEVLARSIMKHILL
jgi:hypothetical protein